MKKYFLLLTWLIFLNPFNLIFGNSNYIHWRANIIGVGINFDVNKIINCKDYTCNTIVQCIPRLMFIKTFHKCDKLFNYKRVILLKNFHNFINVFTYSHYRIQQIFCWFIYVSKYGIFKLIKKIDSLQTPNSKSKILSFDNLTHDTRIILTLKGS